MIITTKNKMNQKVKTINSKKNKEIIKYLQKRRRSSKEKKMN